MRNRECTYCNARSPIRVQTYKHTWYFCDSCGSVDIHPRTWYPLGFTGIPELSRDEAASENQKAMYDYFATKPYATLEAFAAS